MQNDAIEKKQPTNGFIWHSYCQLLSYLVLLPLKFFLMCSGASSPITPAKVASKSSYSLLMLSKSRTSSVY